MSRIGKKPIEIPNGVQVNLAEGVVKVKGPKGELQQAVHPSMKIEVEGSTIRVVPRTEDLEFRRFYGLTRTLVDNMVTGVSQGFSKSLTLVGIGYRAALKGTDLNLTVGYSHPVDFVPPEGITIAVEKQTTVIVSGADKQMVGQVAAKIRSFRPPEPYHGKGIRYSDERIITKVGKAGGKK